MAARLSYAIEATATAHWQKATKGGGGGSNRSKAPPPPTAIRGDHRDPKLGIDRVQGGVRHRVCTRGARHHVRARGTRQWVSRGPSLEHPRSLEGPINPRNLRHNGLDLRIMGYHRVPGWGGQVELYLLAGGTRQEGRHSGA